MIVSLFACDPASTPDVDAAHPSGVESTVEPKGTPAASQPTPISGATAEHLEARTIGVGRALVAYDWQEFYRYLHPEDRIECSSQQFEALQVAAWGPKANLLAELGADEDSEVEVRVHSVKVSDNEGFTVIAYYQDGQLLFEDEEEAPWEFVNDEWYMASTGSCRFW